MTKRVEQALISAEKHPDDGQAKEVLQQLEQERAEKQRERDEAKQKVQAAVEQLTQRSQLVRIVVVYDPEDEAGYKKLSKHLALLIRNQTISITPSGHPPANEEADKWLFTQINRADLVLLLVSSNLFAMPNYEGIEAQTLQLREANRLSVIPIWLSNVFMDQFSKLKQYGGLPRHKKFISKFGDQDEAYTEVAKGIYEVVKSIVEKKK